MEGVDAMREVVECTVFLLCCAAMLAAPGGGPDGVVATGAAGPCVGTAARAVGAAAPDAGAAGGSGAAAGGWCAGVVAWTGAAGVGVDAGAGGGGAAAGTSGSSRGRLLEPFCATVELTLLITGRDGRGANGSCSLGVGANEFQSSILGVLPRAESRGNPKLGEYKSADVPSSPPVTRKSPSNSSSCFSSSMACISTRSKAC
mmetsp:Transcript_13668/g.29331  ORF Transcript_13668/g.29331 Transcript_13668/m.29331 type:complete len:202 (+) Transcript_13668:1062-1667(+)